MTVFQRGDIVEACLNPAASREFHSERRPCLVLSPVEFNKLGLTIVVPITQSGNYARIAGFAVSLVGTGTRTQGMILASDICSIKLNARQAKRVEKAPTAIVDEVLAILNSILE